MVNALDSRSSACGSDLSSGRGTALCSCEGHFTLTVPLFTQEYKWVPVNLMLGVICDGLASHPRGSRNTVSHFRVLQKPG